MDIAPLQSASPASYRPTERDLKKSASVAAVTLLAEDIGLAMRDLDARYRLRISTLEKRVSDLEKQLEAKP